MPRGFTALSVTLPGSTESRPLPPAMSSPDPATTVIRSWLYSSAQAEKPAVRQSPGPEASAYSNVWLQCCQAKLLPSGAVRGSPSIQILDGHPLHERISDICSVPSGVTTPPGVPRFSSATDRSASGAVATAASPVSSNPSTSASARSSARAVTTAASSPGPVPATISTGRSDAPRTSALGAKASARLRAAGTHTRAVPPAASAFAYPGPAADRTSAVNAFTSGPPSAILTSGRLESASSPPYRDPPAWLHVAVTPAAASATIRSRITSRSAPPSVLSGQTTSATPIASTGPATPPARTRAVEPTPNHW